MADNVIITKTYREDHWVVSAEMQPDPLNVIPDNPFIYENLGTSELGPYQGVCSFEELQRLRVWTGEIVPVFGNRFVRYSKAESHLLPGADPDRTVSIIRSSLASLKQELLSKAETSQIYPV